MGEEYGVATKGNLAPQVQTALFGNWLGKYLVRQSDCVRQDPSFEIQMGFEAGFLLDVGAVGNQAFNPQGGL